MNSYNFVHEQSLQPVSIETLGILVALVYFAYLVYKKQASLEIAYFLSLPFSDVVFRVADVQPVELLSLVIIALNYRRIRLHYVLMLASIFLLFSLIGYITGSSQGSYSLFYSLRFLLTALVFTIFVSKEFPLPVSVMRFVTAFCFGITFLQVSLWLAGLPIHGVFYDSLIPRAKGLAQEPAPWAIWVVSLFPYILYFRLGRLYLILNLLTLLMTFSTFGVISTIAFFLFRVLLSGDLLRLRLRLTTRHLVGGVAAFGALTGVLLLAPSALEGLSKTLVIFDKLVYYEYDLARFTGIDLGPVPAGLTVSQSGRQGDLLLFQKYFPDHLLVGIGSFNGSDDENRRGPPATNTYITFLFELGVLGMSLVFVTLLLHYSVLFRHRREKSRDFLAFCLTFLVMISGIRGFAFHELWYAQANTLRLQKGRFADAEAPELPPLAPLVEANV